MEQRRKQTTQTESFVGLATVDVTGFSAVLAQRTTVGSSLHAGLPWRQMLHPSWTSGGQWVTVRRGLQAARGLLPAAQKPLVLAPLFPVYIMWARDAT